MTVVAILAAVAARRFPWHVAGVALRRAELRLLLTALVVNLVSIVAKGWSWYLLLRQVARCRWRTVQEANLAGTAVNSISVSFVGEAARIHHLVTREPVPVSSAVASVMWTRAVEGVALAILLVTAPFVLDLPPLLHRIEAGALVLLVLLVSVFLIMRRKDAGVTLPGSLGSFRATLSGVGRGRRLVVPCLLGLVNWAAQWATFYLVLRAVHVSDSAAASFAALVATNLSGLLRLAPANVGIFQAAMAFALLSFGVSAQAAVTGGVAIQAIQVPPVLALALPVIGWTGLLHREPLQSTMELEEEPVHDLRSSASLAD